MFVGVVRSRRAALLVAWAMRPEQFREIVNSHHLYDANRFNVLQGVREVTSWVGLTARSEVFWDYLNPAFLFVTGRVLAWPLAILLPIGLYYALVKDATMSARLALCRLPRRTPGCQPDRGAARGRTHLLDHSVRRAVVGVRGRSRATPAVRSGAVVQRFFRIAALAVTGRVMNDGGHRPSITSQRSQPRI